ncbi:hypothetical protein KCP74_01725 [Salmonella enterica subsp. enterica]|nr:hypothetical protein KCP74_01725 [Salmonella enterica subsp. enterica]
MLAADVIHHFAAFCALFPEALNASATGLTGVFWRSVSARWWRSLFHTGGGSLPETLPRCSAHGKRSLLPIAIRWRRYRLHSAPLRTSPTVRISSLLHMTQVFSQLPHFVGAFPRRYASPDRRC